MYPFNLSDLNACSQIAKQQVDISDRVPWQDLRFLFGDVIYGGHITDPFDRNLLNTYLELFACDELMSGFEILPGLQTPAGWDDTIENLTAHVSIFHSCTLDLSRTQSHNESLCWCVAVKQPSTLTLFEITTGAPQPHP